MKKKKSKFVLFITDIFFMGILIAIDQYTKYLAVLHLKDKPAYTVLNGVIELNYLENKGAAFGILQNQRMFFIFVAVIILLVIAYILLKMPNRRKYKLMRTLLSLIASGAIGNLIDRVRFDHVVDFIYITSINFPIFNVADIYVTVATAILVLALLFYYKEADLGFIGFKQKKYREVR